MITTLLKQKYQEAVEKSNETGAWIKQEFSTKEFINQMAVEHNTTPDMIKQLLKDCDWFR